MFGWLLCFLYAATRLRVNSAPSSLPGTTRLRFALHGAQRLRLPRLFEELHLAHGDGRFHKLMSSFAKIDLIVLDDWGLAKLHAEQRRDLLELLDDRHGHRSTIVTSQLPVDHWHEVIGDPTLADAILDRLVHNAYRLHLKGESMRKRHAKLTLTTESE